MASQPKAMSLAMSAMAIPDPAARKADGDSYTRDAEGNYWYVTPYGKRYLCTVD